MSARNTRPTSDVEHELVLQRNKETRTCEAWAPEKTPPLDQQSSAWAIVVKGSGKLGAPKDAPTYIHAYIFMMHCKHFYMYLFAFMFTCFVCPSLPSSFLSMSLISKPTIYESMQQISN